MDYQKKIDVIKQQINASLSALEELSVEIRDIESSPAVSSIEQTHDKQSITALAAYLALGADIKDNALLTMILKSAMYVVNAGGAGLTLLDPETNTLIFKAAIGDGAEDIIGYSVPLEGSQHGLAFATGEVQSSTPIDTAIEDITNVKFKNVLVAPLFINEDTIGTISAVNKQSSDHFTPLDMEAYKHFSELASMVVRQRQREEILKDLMAGSSKISDELGGIYFSDNDKQIMLIIQDVIRIADHNDELLPQCKQLTQLLVDMSQRNQFHNGSVIDE